MKSVIVSLIIGSVALSSASFACADHQQDKKVVKKPVVEQPKK